MNYERPSQRPSNSASVGPEKLLLALQWLRQQFPYDAGYSQAVNQLRQLSDQWNQLLMEAEAAGEPDQSGIVNMNEEPNSHRTLPAVEGAPLSDADDLMLEAKAYPHLFPNGTGSFNDPQRSTKLSLREYIVHRLLESDERFGADPSWIFRTLIQLNRSDMLRAAGFVIHSILPARVMQQQGQSITAGSLRQHLLTAHNSPILITDCCPMWDIVL